MSKIAFFIILSLIISTAGKLYSQQKVLEVRGVLIDENHKPVQFAHVINYKKNVACISDTAGKFRILMVKTDTIKITCIGYETAFFTLSNRNISAEENSVYAGTVNMFTKVYDLEEINIYRERWKSFLYDYSQVEVKEEPYKKQIEHWKKTLVTIDELKQLTRAANGNGFAFNLNKKHEKAVARVNELKKQIYTLL